VIDTASSSVIWYQATNHSSLLHWSPRNPYLTLLDQKVEVRGTAAPILGPLPEGLTISSSFVPYHPLLPTSSTPPVTAQPSGLGRLVTFSDSNRMRLNCLNTETLGSKTTSELSVSTSTGLDRFKFSELLAFMSLNNVNCLILIDARVPQSQTKFYFREAHSELGPRAVCLSPHLRKYHPTRGVNPSKLVGIMSSL